MTIYKYEITSDDDPLTVEQVKKLPTVKYVPKSAAIIQLCESFEDAEWFYKELLDADYRVYLDGDEETVYLVEPIK